MSRISEIYKKLKNFIFPEPLGDIRVYFEKSVNQTVTDLEYLAATPYDTGTNVNSVIDEMFKHFITGVYLKTFLYENTFDKPLCIEVNPYTKTTYLYRLPENKSSVKGVTYFIFNLDDVNELTVKDADWSTITETWPEKINVGLKHTFISNLPIIYSSLVPAMKQLINHARESGLSLLEYHRIKVFAAIDPKYRSNYRDITGFMTLSFMSCLKPGYLKGAAIFIDIFSSSICVQDSDNKMLGYVVFEYEQMPEVIPFVQELYTDLVQKRSTVMEK